MHHGSSRRARDARNVRGVHLALDSLQKDTVASSTWSRKTRLLPVAEAGKHILLAEDEHGRFLGRARALPDRLKNLLPRRVVL